MVSDDLIRLLMNGQSQPYSFERPPNELATLLDSRLSTPFRYDQMPMSNNVIDRRFEQAPSPPRQIPNIPDIPSGAWPSPPVDYKWAPPQNVPGAPPQNTAAWPFVGSNQYNDISPGLAQDHFNSAIRKLMGLPE